MLVYEYKLNGNQKQFAAIEEAIRVVQFIRNKCLRLWMDGERVSKNDLQTYCAVLAKEYPLFLRLLQVVGGNSQGPDPLKGDGHAEMGWHLPVFSACFT